MKYKVRISEMRYGEAIVESENVEAAQKDVYMNRINWFDYEITDITVEPEQNRTYMVVEVCSHCGSESEIRWNTDAQGFKAFCPVCGGCLMLCDECMHTQNGGCDYDDATDGCRFNPLGKAARMEDLRSRDEQLRKLWKDFGELPMNPEIECMEPPFLHFSVGTYREEVWHQFDERYCIGVYSLLYPSSGGRVGVLTTAELQVAYEKQQHIYDIQDIENELEDLSEDAVKKYRLDDMPVTDAELDGMAKALRSKLDNNADSPWSICKSEAVIEVLERRRPICR